MRQRGFSMVELMVTVALGVLLVSLAAPSFRIWINNAQVRAASEFMQSGVRLAQAEAVRRYQQVVFFRTAQQTCNDTTVASDTGAFWAIRTVPNVAGGNPVTVQCGAMSDVAPGIKIEGPAAICFSANGRQMANPDPGAGGGQTCTLGANGVSSFDISRGSSEGSRPMRVLINLGGSVRMCDPAKTFSANTPEGCPS